uniref:Putative secreted protein n=1 Tax=Anopheles darlingi TaxID=43151 RepID=A0A2M4D3H5_ANODA
MLGFFENVTLLFLVPISLRCADAHSGFRWFRFRFTLVLSFDCSLVRGTVGRTLECRKIDGILGALGQVGNVLDAVIAAAGAQQLASLGSLLVVVIEEGNTTLSLVELDQLAHLFERHIVQSIDAP